MPRQGLQQLGRATTVSCAAQLLHCAALCCSAQTQRGAMADPLARHSLPERGPSPRSFSPLSSQLTRGAKLGAGGDGKAATAHAFCSLPPPSCRVSSLLCQTCRATARACQPPAAQLLLQTAATNRVSSGVLTPALRFSPRQSW